ncbi:MAG TPA: Holliday junction resolvase RuvX [Rhodocyclaceae bacterium]|nr:Holliday junction resolvase RuvX [Rhodocyclaceae bacterium]
MPEAGTVLAFDFGVKRIGVAVGETLLGRARALATIAAEDNDTRFGEIARLIGQWQPQILVLGLPLAEDGGEHELTARARRFAHQLEGRFRLPVILVDERYSSREADARLAATGLPWQERKRELDAAAAQIILQDYFDARVDDKARTA